ncbi:MAG: DUF6259 domain-containing protein [Candidatus Sumerlaea chitinivorans]|nr:DUF6259 domain-containing protein [Candidatus Sumerlaea chitinivorans]
MGEEMPVENAAFSISFNSEIPSHLVTIRDRAGRAWTDDQAGVTLGIWRLRLVGPDGTTPEYSPLRSQLVSVSREDEPDELVLKLVWHLPITKKHTGEVSVWIRMRREGQEARWRLRASVPNGWEMLSVDFPVFESIPLDSHTSRVAVPAGWGLEYDLVPGFEYEGKYPSCTATMQFLAFYGSDSCFYVATHDTNGWMKTWRVRAGRQRASLSVSYPLPLGSTTFETPFDVVTALCDGGYEAAAEYYRTQFSYAAVWGSPQPISTRIPDWFLNNDLWLRPVGRPAEILASTKKALRYFSPLPTACHWYRWHQIPYDTHYPDYFPAHDDFGEAVRNLHELGTHVMPYINGRLWDPEAESWLRDGGPETAARSLEGACYTEVYGSRVPNNVACPATETWQRKMCDVIQRLVSELGVHGVYIDQVAAAPAVPCYAANHPHPRGGGEFWVRGYRDMLQRIRKVIPRDVALTTEENAECWIDLFDGHLVVNTPTDEGSPIPLFPLVYSDRAVTFGFQYFPPPEPAGSLAFRVKIARAFLFGAQLGWIEPQRILAPEARHEAEMLRTLGQWRGQVRQFFTEGRMLGLLELECDDPPLQCKAAGSFGGTYDLRVAPLLASAWLAPAGEIGLFAVNVSEEECEGICRVSQLPPLGDLSKGHAVGSSVVIWNKSEIRFRVPPLGAAAVVFPSRD